MEETQSKKVIILYILKILKEFSDEEHPITQSDIIAKLKDYGIDCDRKTITRNIKYLIDYGFNIVRNLGGGCYFINDKYDTSEITFLVDCLYSYPAISQRQAQNLIDKLTSEVSKYERLKFKNIYKSNELTRTDNKQIFYNIDQINFAIANDKQISFIYNKYNKNKKLVPRKEERYIINPYFMINSKGKYFLVCNKDNYDNLSNYRIDYITSVEVLDTKRKSITKTTGNEKGINPINYANEHIYMMSGPTITSKVKLSSDRMINDVIDWFGKSVNFIEKESEIFAEITVNEQALIYWALQYGENVEIVEPITTREKLITYAENILSKYKK